MVKCSLYSPDVDFTTIKGLDFVPETLQMKALAARFLNTMEDHTLRLNVNRLKCAEWMCEQQPMLLRTFVLLFRVILMRLEIDGADNYQQQIGGEEIIVNLVEYFDLSYRNFG